MPQIWILPDPAPTRLFPVNDPEGLKRVVEEACKEPGPLEQEGLRPEDRALKDFRALVVTISAPSDPTRN